MANTLRLLIQEDMKTAMRAKASAELGTIRLLLAAIKQREIDERITLDDPQIIAVIDKMVKQRNESISQYHQGNRQDLVAKEQAEIVILKRYLPPPLTEAEIADLVQTALTATGATTLKELGVVMAYLKPQLQGRADLGKVSTLVKTKLL